MGVFYSKAPQTQTYEASRERILQSPLGSLTDGDGEGNIAHTPPRVDCEEVLGDPKIIFQKPKTFLASCYILTDWTENRKKKTTIVMELHKLVPDKRIVVDDEVHKAN